MSPPKRWRLDGAIYYITTVIYGRLPVFTVPAFVVPLFDNLNFYRHQHSMRLLGYVVMPDHIHILVWPNGGDVSAFMRDFKTMTSKRILRQADVENRLDWLAHFADAGSKTKRSTYKVWQDSFWEVTVFSEKFMRQKLNYIHRNPLRAGLVDTPEAYPYSSYRNYVLDDQSLIEIDRGWS